MKRLVSIIAGGQYGSEGKGKVAYFWTKKICATVAVRVGGSNSGHTVYDDNNNEHIFRMLPTACLLDNVVSVLPAGAYIDVDVLKKEIDREDIKRDTLFIDPNAVIIDDGCILKEKNGNLRDKIGSTLSGTGAAVIRRVGRLKDVTFAKDCEELKKYLCDTKSYMRQVLDRGDRIVIEGTQGYGLSNIHAKLYPYATSRDTTVAGFLSETGLSPLDVEHVVLVIRAFPIRVAGNSGPLNNEVDWNIISKESGCQGEIKEFTTVTHKVRRVARFSSDVVKDAICANNPDVIVLNHIDYIDWKGREGLAFTEEQKLFISKVENSINRHIDFIGNGKASLCEN